MAPVDVDMGEQKTTVDPVSVMWHATYSRIQDSGELIGRSEEDPQLLIGAKFSLRVDHGLADGIGAYILAGKYLKLVAEKLIPYENR